MGPEAEASLGGEGGYSAAMLARHVTLCLTRMRRVVREMLEARAGWSAFAAVTSASALAMGVETALRSRLAPEAGVELAQDAGAVANALNAGLWMFVLFALLAVLFATAWWLTARLFGRKITFLQSALGVAAGGLPQVTISAAMVACALVLSLFAEVE